MFPNFTSLAQREQKRHELLEKTQRRVRQAKAKRGMYEGASWASDADKTITTIAKTSSESTQTDMPEEKKNLSDENSVKIPEVSPVMVEAGTQSSRVNTTDRNVQASPQTSDAGMERAKPLPGVLRTAIETDTPTMVDAGTQSISTKKPTKSIDSEYQIDAREWIKALFSKSPNWASLKIHPIRRKTGRDDNRYFLGPKASLILIKSEKKTRNYQSIDWMKTEAKIRDILYDGESNSIDEVGAMRDEETLTRTLMRLEKKKRAGDELEDLNVILKDRRLPDIRLSRKSTSTTSDNVDAKIKLLWVISKSIKMLESNGLMKSIVPIFKYIYQSDESRLRQYVWVKNGSIDVYGKDSNLKHTSPVKKVDWQSTFRAFLVMVNDIGLKLIPTGNMDNELVSKTYDAAGDELEARFGTKTGVDEDRDPNLSIPDSDAKVLLTEYYKSLFDKKVSIPFRLRPVVDAKNGSKTHQSYYFGQPMRERVLNTRNKADKPVSWQPYGDLMKTIRWMDTFQSLLTDLEDAHRTASDIEAPAGNDELKMIDNVNSNLETIREVIFSNASDIKQQSSNPYEHDDKLQKIHDGAEAAFQEYGEAQRQLEALKTTGLSRRNNSALKAARAAVKATKAVYSIKAKKYIELVREKQEEEERERSADAFELELRAGASDFTPRIEKQRRSGLKGRGLRGAGVAPLDGVVRRGRTYNLNEIQGLATPSAYVYRQIGSKYIRLPDLDGKTLVIVQPNRRKCGPKCKISDSLQSMIKALVYKQHIDQAAYDKLTIDDRKMFKEILAITHLQYQFHDKLDDPLDSLRAEYDKLKGEMDLGNDNPSVIKQLKSLSIDMYSNRLISDSEFRDIITRLI